MNVRMFRTLARQVLLNSDTIVKQVNLIMANEITPHLTAEEYMDKGEYENELKQVIGDTKVTLPRAIALLTSS